MKTYKFSKTLEKGLWVLGHVFVAGAIVLATDSKAALLLALVPVLEMLRNWIKHRNKTDEQ